MDLKKEPFIKTEFRVEDMKYNWIKQEIKGEEDDAVMGNKSDMIKNETCNPELINELTGTEIGHCDDDQILSMWSYHPTYADTSAQHNRKDKHALTSTDLLAMEMKSLGL